MTARTLVTGGAGFIGSHLVETLLETTEVVVLDALTTGSAEAVPDGATLRRGDIRDEGHLAELVADVDTIYHQAGLVSVAESVERPLESQSTNVAGTLAVLEAARASDTRVVAASSAAIYGQPESVPICESDPTRPTSPYGLEKLALDHYCRLYHDLYGLETVSLRYFNVYGPGQPANDYSGVISIFIDRALAGEPLEIYGDGEQTRDFVYVDDVVRANRRAAETNAVGRSFNVATGEQVSIRELAETIVGVTDSDSDIVHVEPRPGDIRHSVADVTEATDSLEFAAAVDLETGLERTVEWARS